MPIYNKLFILVCALVLNVFAQTSPDDKGGLSGNLSFDSKMIFSSNMPAKQNLLPIESSSGRKSPALAGLMSLIIPGAGELYTGRYVEAGIFFAVDIAAIVVAASYNSKANTKTTEFQKYADQKWSAVNFAKWVAGKNNVADYSKWIDTVTGKKLISGTDTTWSFNPFKASWDRVDWTMLNVYLDSLNLSHKLEKHGLQQYYELIGKYPEFYMGWDGVNNDEVTKWINNSSLKPEIVSIYMAMRGKANDYYNYSSKAVVVVYLNHFLSAINAAWDAVLYNKDLKLSSRIETKSMLGITYFEPTLSMQLKF